MVRRTDLTWRHEDFCHVRALFGLGQREGAQLVAAGHGRQPPGLLLTGAEGADGGHGQAAVYHVEGTDAAVAAGEFRGGEPFGDGCQGASSRGCCQPAVTEVVRKPLRRTITHIGLAAQDAYC